jgi:diguanylate cyclase (GGDEF)-like protein
MMLTTSMASTTDPTEMQADEPGGRRKLWRPILLASLALALLLGALATTIAISKQQSRSQLLASFRLRGTSSATFVSTYVAQQAAREGETARELLAGPQVSGRRFSVVVAAFGSPAAVLLDAAGRLIDGVPADPSLLGQPLTDSYPHLRAAERGAVAVSNVIPSATSGPAVAAVAVPFSSARGRRVFSASYAVSGSALAAFVEHAVSTPDHHVFLIDAGGHLLAGSPQTSATTLAEADRSLARAAARTVNGTVTEGRTAATFTSAPVPGTPWRLLIALPDNRLFASISGLTEFVPWLVLALVSLLGVLLVALYGRSLLDRSRLATLSRAMEQTARTDPLTGLHNRRGLAEHLTRATAHARRRGEPVSVLMIDLDRFKQTNDRYGHEAGDELLCAIADCMRDVLRSDDVYGRWGGDEFLVALPRADKRQARFVAERLRTSAGEVQLREIGLRDGVPMSVGVATAVHAHPDELVRAADVALYRAKATGRVELESPDRKLVTPALS